MMMKLIFQWKATLFFGLAISVGLTPVLIQLPAQACLPIPGSKPRTLEERFEVTPIIFEGQVLRVK